MGWVNSKYVCNDSDWGLTAQIGYKNYKLGFVFKRGEIRLKLIWWHYCKFF